MILSPKEKIKLTPIIGLDLETNGLYPWINDILVISITTQDKLTYVLECRNYTKEQLTDLFTRITKECKTVVGHNIKFDCGFIYYHYGVLLDKLWDTLLAAQLINAGRPKSELDYTLPAVAYDFTGVNLIGKDEKKYYQNSFIGLPANAILSEKQLYYAGDDTRFLIVLYEAQKKVITKHGLDIVMRMENRLIPVVSKIEVNGCKVDKTGWIATIKLWERKRDEYVGLLDNELKKLSETNPKLSGKYTRERKIQNFTVLDIFGGSSEVRNSNLGNVNYSSSDQILEIFTLLDQPLPKVIKKAGEKHNKVTLKVDTAFNSASEDALNVYITEYPRSILRNFIDILLKYREYEKLISTYGEEFLSKLDANDFIHTEYSQCFTDTGRFSSRNPNLQNIPKTSLEKDGYDLRRFFIPDSELYTFVTSDMEGAEIRVAADYSKEPMLVASLLDGEDLHSKLASASFTIIFGKKTKITNTDKQIAVQDKLFKAADLRQAHKSVLFAKFYKGGAKRVYEILAEYINLFNDNAIEVAQKVSKAIDRKLPVLTEYLSSLIEKAQQDGYLTANKLGRRRYFSANAYGNAANFPIQGTNADAMKLALIKLDDYFNETGYGRIVLTVHDEVVCCVLKKVIEEVSKKIGDIMADSLGYFLSDIPGKSSVSFNDFWEK